MVFERTLESKKSRLAPRFMDTPAKVRPMKLMARDAWSWREKRMVKHDFYINKSRT